MVGRTITTELQPWSVKQCNDLVQSLKDAGMDANEIHGIDRVLAVEWQAHAATKVTQSGNFGFGYSHPYSTPMQSTITCKAITPPVEVVGSDDISLPAPDFELIDTDLSVFYTASGQCPKDILVSSNTRTNVPGQFELWYEIQSANAGNLKSVDYALATGTAGDAGFWEAPHMDTFQVPLSGLSSTGDGQGPAHAVGASDLLPGVGAGGSGTGSGASTAAGDFNNAATTPINQHSGKIRAVAQYVGAVQGGSPGGLVGEPAAQTVVSAWKDYLVVCEYDAEPVIGDLPSDITGDMDDQPSQNAAIPGLGNKITGVSGQETSAQASSERVQRKLDEFARQQQVRDKAAKRNLQAAVKARQLKAEAEARRKALVAAQQAAEKKRRATLEAETKKAQAKAHAEAKRKALIAKQESEAAKRLAAIEASKQRAAKKHNRLRRLQGKKPDTGLQATLRQHSN